MAALIAVTGGIAAGKTVLTDYCAARYHIPILDTDHLTHQLLNKDKEVHALLHDLFGSDVFASPGVLDRAHLRERVFAELDNKAKLESLMHPKIRAVVASFAEHARSPFVLVAVPLLVETQGVSRYTRIVVVDSPLEDRMQRCEARGLSRTTTERIMASQANRWQRLAVADDIVYNMRHFDFFYAQIDRLVCQYRHIFD